MSKLTLKERRRLEFTGALLREAVLTFDREHNGRLWRAVNPSVMVVGRGDGRIEIACDEVDVIDAIYLHCSLSRRFN